MVSRKSDELAQDGTETSDFGCRNCRIRRQCAELFAPINFEKATTNGETPTIDQPMA